MIIAQRDEIIKSMALLQKSSHMERFKSTINKKKDKIVIVNR